jgi:signal recognition particle GTPase
MSKTLHISDDVKLPLEMAAEAACIVGVRGSGKTNTARAMAEELFEAGIPICVIDPTDAWWGLRSTRDGRGDGYPVFIFGGEHGDLPLEETHGKTIAEFLVSERVPVVLSLRHLRKNAQRRFVTDLAEELYHLKGKPENRQPLTVFIDEAPLFIPQRVMGEMARTVGAVEDLIARGRNAGFGVVLIGQRFATMNKDVTTQAGTIICHRTTSPQDRKAIAEWIEENATIEQQKETLSTLATLADGQAWIWATRMNLYQCVQMRLSTTFDSGATPKLGQRIIQPKRLAEIDKEKLKARMSAAVESKKANDPAELKKRVQQLERELHSAKPARTVEQKTVEKLIVKDAQISRLEKIVNILERIGPTYLEKLQPLIDRQCTLQAAASELRAAIVAAKANGGISARKGAVIEALKHPWSPDRAPAPRPSPRPSPARGEGEDQPAGITNRQQKFLDAAATLTTLNSPVTRETVSAWVGVHPRGGSVGEELKALVQLGFIDHERGTIHVTEAGMAAAGTIDPTTAIETAKGGLTNRQREFFEIICRAYPEATTREAIAQEKELHPRGGSLGEDLGRLVGRGLVEVSRGQYRARDFLFVGATSGR